MRRPICVVLAGAALLAVAVMPLSCFEGGANMNMQGPGNNDQGGVDLGGDGDNRTGFTSAPMGAIAVAPDGSYFLSSSRSRLVQGVLATGKVHVVDEVGEPGRVAMAHKEPRYYVVSKTTDQVYAVSSSDRSVVWFASTSGLGSPVRVYTSENDAHVLLAGPSTLELRDAATGKEQWSLSPGTIRDVDITPDSKTAVVTLNHAWKGSTPSTPVRLVTLATGKSTVLTVPNCTSAMVLSPDGAHGFLAPTTCVDPTSKAVDPVSVIDLKKKTFVRNLPGFGPVAMASDGKTAVAFMDANNLDLSLFDDKSKVPSSSSGRYHLMLLDTRTLEFDSVPLGDSLPRYTLTPDGKVVLIDPGSLWTAGGIQILDVATRTLHKVSGVELTLNHFVVSPSSADVYLLHAQDLYWLSVAKRAATNKNTNVVCASLNITPDGAYLLIKDYDHAVHLYDLSSDSVVHTMKAPGS